MTARIYETGSVYEAAKDYVAWRHPGYSVTELRRPTVEEAEGRDQSKLWRGVATNQNGADAVFWINEAV